MKRGVIYLNSPWEIRPKYHIKDRYLEHLWRRHQMETFSALLALCVGNSPVNSPHNSLCRGALMFSLICEWINNWVNNRETGYLIHHRAHYDVIVMSGEHVLWWLQQNTFDNISTLGQVMASCCHALSHYWANVDPFLCRHPAPPGHNELNHPNTQNSNIIMMIVI